jgi:hypothetical protein
MMNEFGVVGAIMTRNKTLLSATLSTTNPTRPYLALNPAYLGVKLAAKSLSLASLPLNSTSYII